MTTQESNEPTVLAPKRPEPLFPKGAAPGAARSVLHGTFWIGTYPVGMRLVRNPQGVGEDVVDTELRPYPPKANLSVGKFSFPTRINPITGKNRSYGSSRRTEFLGAIVIWTQNDVAELTDYLKRTWIRWRSRNGKLQDHGYTITIPTKDEVERAKEIADIEKRQIRYPQHHGFVPRLDDEPFSSWVYAVRVDDGTMYPPIVKNEDLPPPISETGIESVE